MAAISRWNATARRFSPRRCCRMSPSPCSPLPRSCCCCAGGVRGHCDGGAAGRRARFCAELLRHLDLVRLPLSLCAGHGVAGGFLLSGARSEQCPCGEAMTVELGIIEGYYGTPWSWDARARVIATLKPHGYAFYIYAPKADAFLRKRWRESHPAESAAALRAVSQRCRAMG